MWCHYALYSVKTIKKGFIDLTVHSANKVSAGLTILKPYNSHMYEHIQKKYKGRMPDLDYNGLNSFYGNSLLGIRMHIRCLTWSTRNGEARSAGETMLCCPLPNRLRVSERSKLLVWWCASRFLSPLSCRLHPFVEQLTVFHTSGLVLASTSILRVLDPDLHRAMASWAAHAKRYVNYA